MRRINLSSAFWRGFFDKFTLAPVRHWFAKRVKSRRLLKPNDILEWRSTRFPHVYAQWRVIGVHLGAPGVESLVEMESVTHSMGWTGEWEYHPRVFVPEQLTRDLKIIRSGE